MLRNRHNTALLNSFYTLPIVYNSGERRFKKGYRKLTLSTNLTFFPYSLLFIHFFARALLYIVLAATATCMQYLRMYTRYTCILFLNSENIIYPLFVTSRYIQ